jgi:hypothetical protein
MNYQVQYPTLSNYLTLANSPLPSVNSIEIDGQRYMCRSCVTLSLFLPFLPSSFFSFLWFLLSPSSSLENRENVRMREGENKREIMPPFLPSSFYFWINSRNNASSEIYLGQKWRANIFVQV